jgi:hypothetical protein
MTLVLFVGGIVLLTLPGLVLCRLTFVRALDLPARLAIGFCGGLLFTSLLMYGYTLLGAQWSRVNLGITLLLLAAAGLFRSTALIRPSAGISQGEKGLPNTQRGGFGRALSGWGLALAVIGVLLYAAADARMTCADLIYFWGSKGVHFDQARQINAEFLRFSDYYLMHPDYPPLLPLVYAWGTLVSRTFSWWGAVMLTPLFLLATVAAFRGLVRREIGEERAHLYTLLLTTLLACCYAVASVGGGGDAPLIFFETLALTTLTFARPGERGPLVIAALALAGCVFTKVEGTAFALVVGLAFLVTRRRIRAAALTLLPGLLLIGSWIWWVKRQKLLDSYGSRNPLSLALLPETLRLTLLKVRYGTLYLPWAAALGPLVLTRNWRRASLPLLTGAGVIGYTLFFYLHAPAPEALWLWIATSVERVAITALMCFVVATAAGSE